MEAAELPRAEPFQDVRNRVGLVRPPFVSSVSPLDQQLGFLTKYLLCDED